MRKVILSDGDSTLFDFELSQEEYNFFERHKKTFLNMWTDQGQEFWVCFVTTFRSFSEKHGYIFRLKKDIESEEVFDALFDFIQDQFCGRERQSKNLIEDIALLAQHQSSIRYIDSKSYTKDPFYNKESREVFRKFFGNPDKGMASIKGSTSCTIVLKVMILSPIYLQFGGSVCRCLQRWLGAPTINCKDFNYFRPTEKVTDRKEKKTEKRSLTVYMCVNCQVKYEKVFEEELENGRPDRPRFVEFWHRGDPRFEDEHNPLYNPSADKNSDWRTDTSENKFKEFVLYARTLYGSPDEKCRKCHNLSKRENSLEDEKTETYVNEDLCDKNGCENCSKKKKKKKKKKKTDGCIVCDVSENNIEKGTMTDLKNMFNSHGKCVKDDGISKDVKKGNKISTSTMTECLDGSGNCEEVMPTTVNMKEGQQKKSNFQFQFNRKVNNDKVEIHFQIVMVEELECNEGAFDFCDSVEKESGKKKWTRPEYVCTKIFHPLAVSLIRSVLEDLPRKFEWYEGCGWCVAVMNYEEEEKQCKPGQSNILIKASGLREDTIKRAIFLFIDFILKRKRRPCPGWFPEEDDLQLCYLPEVVPLELAGLDLTIFKGYRINEVLTPAEKDTQYDFKDLKGRLIPLWWSGEDNADMFKVMDPVYPVAHDLLICHRVLKFLLGKQSQVWTYVHPHSDRPLFKDTESQFIKDKLYSLFLGNGKTKNKRKDILLTDTGMYCHHQKGYATVFDKRGAMERLGRLVDRKCMAMDNNAVVQKYGKSNQLLWPDLVDSPEEFDMFIDVELGTELQYKYLGFFSAQMKFYLTKNMTLKWDLHKILTVCSDKKCGCGVSAVINVGRNCQNSKLENDGFFHRNDQSGLRDETKQLFQEELDTTMGKMGHMIKEMADKATLPNNDSQHLTPLTTTTKTVDGINSTFNFLPNSNGQSVMHVKVRINPDSEYSSKKGKADQLLIPNSRKADDVDKKEKNNKKISSKKSSDTKAMTECAFHTKPSSVLPNENKCSKCNKMLPVSPANIQEVSGAVKQIVHTTGTSIDSSLHASSPTSTDSQITSTDKMKVSGKFSDIHYHKIKSQKVLSSSKDGEEKQIDNTGNKITKCTEQVIKTSSNGAVEKVNTVPPPPLQKASEKSLLRSEQREKMPQAPNIKASLTSSPVVHKTDVLSKDAVKKVNDGEKDLLPSGGKMVITGNSSGFKIHMEDAEKIVTTTSTVTDNTEDGESKRKCFGCGNQEAVFKTYKKCQRCKQEQIKNARYYCGKNCQVADWTARHKMEHIGGKLV